MPKPRIILVPHDPGWARAFVAARAAIMEACGDYVLEVVHIGSTAIPAVGAKPVIDMLALLRRHRDASPASLQWWRQGSNFVVKPVCPVGTSSGKEIQGRTTSTCTDRITRKSGVTSAFATTCAGTPIRHLPTMR